MSENSESHLRAKVNELSTRLDVIEKSDLDGQIGNVAKRVATIEKANLEDRASAMATRISKIEDAGFDATAQLLDKRVSDLETSDIEKRLKQAESKIKKAEEHNFRLKVVGGAIAISVVIVFGVSVAFVPGWIAKSVAEPIARTTAQDRAQEVADEFARTDLPGIVLTQLRSQVKVVEEIEQFRHRAQLASESAAEDARSAAQAASTARDCADEAKKRLQEIQVSAPTKVADFPIKIQCGKGEGAGGGLDVQLSPSGATSTSRLFGTKVHAAWLVVTHDLQRIGSHVTFEELDTRIDEPNKVSVYCKGGPGPDAKEGIPLEVRVVVLYSD